MLNRRNRAAAIGARIVALAIVVLLALPAPASAQGDAEWNRVVAAANKEGAVSVGGPQSAASRRVLEKFQQAYPDIKLRYTGIHGEFWPRLESERANKHYDWDVYVAGSATPTFNAAKKGFLDPIRPAILRDDVLNDKNWVNGFDGTLDDEAKKFVFAFTADRLDLISVNRAKIPESELSSPKQLLDPKYKGQIVMMDPRQQGVGALTLGSLRKDLGDEGARRFLAEQAPVFTTDRRQAAEWVVRGRYSIGVGVIRFFYAPFAEQGLTKDIGMLKAVYPLVSSGQSTVTLMANPPHPNAAKVFINWLLSKETQEDWAKSTGSNSLRTDVPSGNPETRVSTQDFKTLPRANNEEGSLFFFENTGEFAQRVLK